MAAEHFEINEVDGVFEVTRNAPVWVASFAEKEHAYEWIANQLGSETAPADMPPPDPEPSMSEPWPAEVQPDVRPEAIEAEPGLQATWTEPTVDFSPDKQPEEAPREPEPANETRPVPESPRPVVRQIAPADPEQGKLDDPEQPDAGDSDPEYIRPPSETITGADVQRALGMTDGGEMNLKEAAIEMGKSYPHLRAGVARYKKALKQYPKIVPCQKKSCPEQFEALTPEDRFCDACSMAALERAAS